MPLHSALKIFFIHIPKTGGSSFEKIARDVTGCQWEFWGKIHSIEAYRKAFPGRPDITRRSPDRSLYNPKFKENVYHHLTLSDAMKAYDVNRLLEQGYSFVSIYRNPFDRLVSLYEYGRQNGGLMMTNGKTFAEWFYDRPVSPQSQGYLVDDSLKVPSYIKILDFSNFSLEVSRFIESLGISASGLPHEKKTNRKPWRDYYDDGMLKLGKDEFAADICLGKQLGMFCE